MAANVIMPALEMAQETGKVIRWLVAPGTRVEKGQAIVEIETDKITVEIEAPAAGVLGSVTANEGDVVPVGTTIAVIAAAGEAVQTSAAPAAYVAPVSSATAPVEPAGAPSDARVKASPLARKLAEQHGVDIAQIRTASGKVEKADVLAYVEQRGGASAGNGARLSPASPKARRLARERGVELATVRGSGPGGAVLAADVPASASRAAGAPSVGTVWRVMAERMTQSWTTVPHFYLVREVNASRLISWREAAAKRTGAKITHTDLLVKLVAAALVEHPRVRVSWKDGALIQHDEINIGLAVAIEDGLVVPVIHRADTLSLAEIAARREELVTRAQSGKLRPADITGGVFTISNLGMYGVDAFNAIVNPPQAAILAVGRIAERVVAVNGQPAVQPTTVLTLSCDHRAVDGARGAMFLDVCAEYVTEPLTVTV
ncbi:MAG TPA: 2-oxo acid dehydrogenase subunit E2 [Terriglobales bacterium]|nr:2-oxo acid dehydrogenase subunit E2 [Terriglobales bacterium]